MKLESIYNPLTFVQCPDIDLKYVIQYLDEETTKGYVDLDPEFQRGHVWSTEQQEAFMGHLLSGGVVQPIVFSILGNRDIGKKVLVDGKQRLNAIRRWMNNEIDAVTPNGVRFKRDDVEDDNYYFMRITIKIGYVHVPHPSGYGADGPEANGGRHRHGRHPPRPCVLRILHCACERGAVAGSPVWFPTIFHLGIQRGRVGP